MTTLFISDLHLEENRPEMTALFLKWLDNAPQYAKSLYILGDFFEVWIGDDDDSPYHQTIIAALAAASDRGLAIYFMHGNRDFLLGKKFFAAAKCRLLPDEQVIDLYGSPTLLLHGDTLCTADLAYLKFRKKARSWLFKKLILLKSLEKRQAIAKMYREKSKTHTSTAPDNIMDVTQHEVQSVMLKHQVRHLIHGHTHRPGVHQFALNGQAATRTVLGAWHEHGSVLICDENGKKELIIL